MSVEILLLEDDEMFGESLAEFLTDSGFTVLHLLDSKSALDLLFERSFDLYIFDVNLPYDNGFDLLRELRNSDDMTPTIFLTSRDQKSSKESGFSAGADEYIVKPPDLDELLWRINALLRRSLKTESLKIGEYHIDCASKELYRGGDKQEMSTKAIELLLLLLNSQGGVLTLDQIRSELWQHSLASDGSLRVYVAQIRRYFPDCLENIRGVGYRFVRRV